MDTCPHCSAATIPGWRKASAISARPVRCLSCKGLSYVSGWSHLFAAVLLEVVLWGSIIVAIVLHSWYALLLMPIGFVGLTLVGRSAALHPTDASAVTRARIVSIVEFAAIFAVVGGAYLLFGSAS